MSSLIFKDIDSDFKEGVFAGISIIIMKTDKYGGNGYINITKLVGQSKTKTGEPKTFGPWKQGKKAAETINSVMNETGLSEKELIIDPKNVKISLRGTYVHELLSVPIASWASPKFEVKICSFLIEWRNYSIENEKKYWLEFSKSLTESENDKLIRDEKWYSDLVSKEEDGEREVEDESGFIDVLTKTKIIEIKHAPNWKHALGQVLAYGLNYPEHEKWLYLFFKKEKDTFDQELLINKCKKYDVAVRFL